MPSNPLFTSGPVIPGRQADRLTGRQVDKYGIPIMPCTQQQLAYEQLIFIKGSADKHIPSKTSRSVSSVPWITPEIRRKIRRKNAKAKKTGSAK